MQELQKSLNCRKVPQKTKDKTIKSAVFPADVDMDVNAGSNMKMIASSEMGCWRRTFSITCISRKTNKWAGDEIKPEISPDKGMTQPGLSNFGHIIRGQDSLGKTIMLNKLEGSRKRGGLT